MEEITGATCISISAASPRCRWCRSLSDNMLVSPVVRRQLKSPFGSTGINAPFREILNFPSKM